MRGKWQKLAKGTVWLYASSIALGVLLEGNVVEDAALLRKKKDFHHINVAELDAAMKGINMAVTVFCYNSMLRLGSDLDSVPHKAVYRYEWRIICMMKRMKEWKVKGSKLVIKYGMYNKMGKKGQSQRLIL